MMIVQTTRGEKIIITNLTVFEIEDPFLIVKNGPLTQKFTLTKQSLDRLNDWIFSELEGESEHE